MNWAGAQLPSATDRPVLLSDRDFHPNVGAYSQAHLSSPFGARISSGSSKIEITLLLRGNNSIKAFQPEGLTPHVDADELVSNGRSAELPVSQ